MHDLNDGIKIVDTPGIKSFGIVDINHEELDNYFPEFSALKSNCRFNNCMHVKEPNCAIKLGLESLQESLEDSLNHDTVEISIVDASGYKKLNHEETLKHRSKVS